MHIQTPAKRSALHVQVLRATRACQDLRAAMIEIGAIATPDGDSERRALELLDENIYSAMLLLSVIADCSAARTLDSLLLGLGLEEPVGGMQ
jgi:hypothetical protein